MVVELAAMVSWVVSETPMDSSNRRFLLHTEYQSVDTWQTPARHVQSTR